MNASEKANSNGRRNGTEVGPKAFNGDTRSDEELVAEVVMTNEVEHSDAGYSGSLTSASSTNCAAAGAALNWQSSKASPKHTTEPSPLAPGTPGAPRCGATTRCTELT